MNSDPDVKSGLTFWKEPHQEKLGPGRIPKAEAGPGRTMVLCQINQPLSICHATERAEQ